MDGPRGLSWLRQAGVLLLLCLGFYAAIEIGALIQDRAKASAWAAPSARGNEDQRKALFPLSPSEIVIKDTAKEVGLHFLSLDAFCFVRRNSVNAFAFAAENIVWWKRVRPQDVGTALSDVKLVFPDDGRTGNFGKPQLSEHHINDDSLRTGVYNSKGNAWGKGGIYPRQDIYLVGLHKQIGGYWSGGSGSISFGYIVVELECSEEQKARYAQESEPNSEPLITPIPSANRPCDANSSAQNGQPQFCKFNHDGLLRLAASIFVAGSAFGFFWGFLLGLKNRR